MYVELLGDTDEDDFTTPTVIDSSSKNVQTTIIAGEYNGVKASVDTITNLAIYRVKINRSYETWTYRPSMLHSTIIIYVRLGSITIDGIRIPAHCTAYLSPPQSSSSLDENEKNEHDNDFIQVTSEEYGADFLVLAGEPLKNQTVSARGSMVLSTPSELEQAYIDYERGDMGIPWSEQCTDEEWRRHLRKNRIR